MARNDSTKYQRIALRSALRFGAAALAFNILAVGGAYASVLDNYIFLPGVKGDAKIKAYQEWIKFEGSYWKRQGGGGGFGGRGGVRIYSGPNAPLKGEGTLVVALDKRSPVLAKLMDMCARKAVIPELSYAENSELNRYSTEVGPRPASVPEYFEYKLQNVTVSSCPVLADAPEQGFVLTFKDVQWLNYQPPAPPAPAAVPAMAMAAAAGGAGTVAAGVTPAAGGVGAAPAAGAAGAPAPAAGGARGGRAGAAPVASTSTPTTLTPAVLRPTETSGETRTYVMQWFGYAHDILEGEDQCPTVTDKPTPEDYFKYFSPTALLQEQARLGERGPTDFCARGPEQLDVCRLPGVVPDPVQPSPVSNLARGLDLDGDDGSGAPPPGIRKHKNFVTADGRTGIDNQLFVVEGCMRGLRGHEGQLLQFANESRKNGSLAMMIQINGIDDQKNDDSIDVTLFYSRDPVAKTSDGNAILADYTFRVTDNIDFTHSFKRWHGRIVNGVVVTDPDPEPLKTNLNQDSTVILFNSAMRLEFMPDRSLKGVLAGYQDWRKIVNAYGTSLTESLFGGHTPSMYNAMKRQADGMQDPVTGEYRGISSAYDVEAVPAFVIPDARKSVLASAETQDRKAR